MDYSIEELIDVVFSLVEDLEELSEMVGILFTSQQSIDIRYLIISKHRIFRSDIHN